MKRIVGRDGFPIYRGRRYRLANCGPMWSGRRPGSLLLAAALHARVVGILRMGWQGDDVERYRVPRPAEWDPVCSGRYVDRAGGGLLFELHPAPRLTTDSGYVFDGDLILRAATHCISRGIWTPEVCA